MTLIEFLNALRILRSIDRYEFIDAGLKLNDKDWMDFRDGPYRWLCLANGEDAELVWQIVESRQPKEEPDHGEI